MSTSETPTPKFSLKKRADSFVFAFRGILLLFKHEHNARIHLIAAAFAIISGVLFHISPIEWCLIIFAIALVVAAELFNSAIERLVDMVSPEFNEKAGAIKDLAAAGVLICAIASAAIGVYIFLPKVFLIFGLILCA